MVYYAYFYAALSMLGLGVVMAKEEGVGGALIQIAATLPLFGRVVGWW